MVAENSIVWRPAGISAQDAARRRAGSRGRASRRPRRAPAMRHVRRGRGGPAWPGRCSRPGVPTTTSTPLLQRLDLRLVRAAAVDGEHADRRARCRPSRGRSATCTHELAGRDDDEGLRLAGAASVANAVVAGGDDALQQRDAEAEGLAGAGLGLADDVVAGAGRPAGSCAWIGNGWVMPTASRASTMAGRTPSSAKVGCSGQRPFASETPQRVCPGAARRRGATAGRSEAGLVGRSRSVRRATGHPFYGRQPTPRYAAATVDAPEQRPPP